MRLNEVNKKCSLKGGNSIGFLTPNQVHLQSIKNNGQVAFIT